MSDFLHESIHRPQGSFPYIQLENRDFNYIIHFHEEMEVIYVEYGSVTALCEADTLELDAGDFCVFLPGELHGLKSVSRNNLHIIKYRAEADHESVDFIRLRPRIRKLSPSDPVYGTVFGIWQTLCREFTEQLPGYEFALRACTDQLSTLLLRQMPLEDVAPRAGFDLLLAVNRMLEERYEGPISLTDAADCCHLSKYHFAREFKRRTGMTFVYYLSLFRLEKALVLLRSTKLSVGRVAEECGFGSVRSMQLFFRDYLGMTPQEYRRGG